MLNMSKVNDIKDLRKSGYKISEIHEKTGADPKTIKKYIAMDDFSPKPPVETEKETILSPHIEKIKEWLEEDKKHWQKQHHTARRVYKRLTEECGYTGSYDTVRKYMKKVRTETRETGTLELVWEPGYAQVDFGEADVLRDGEQVRMKYLTVSFPYSNDGYCQMFDGETAECVCQGLKDIFEYIGGVPTDLIFDNATGVGRRISEKVIETELFSRFHAHYGFSVRFCNPYAGYEKGCVENKVGTIRRNLFVPVPSFHEVEKFNQELLDRHREKASEEHYKKGTRISELFEEDKAHFMPLPTHRFDVCRYESFKADGYGKICMDGKHYYSTKPENHNQKVVCGIRAHYIDILNPDGTVLVRHRRQYGESRTDIIDYTTTLEMLNKNIGAWKNSGIRTEVPDMIRDYIDESDKQERKLCIRILSDLTKQYGYGAAEKALAMTISNGNVNTSDAAIIAARITGYGIDTPPDAGPSLAEYDRLLTGAQSRAEVTV